jgi:beta-N-acetylhexosaminidase
VLADPPWGRNVVLAALIVLALAAAAAGVLIGSSEDDDRGASAELREPGRKQPQDRVSFLARIIPPPAGSSRAAADLPRAVSRGLRELPLEGRVAQLFLLGVSGRDSGAEALRLPERPDPGGVVVAGPDHAGPGKGPVPPFVMAVQEGGALNSFPALPPAQAPADLGSVRDARRQTLESARALRGLKVSGVLGPVVDVGLEGDSALGGRLYSDDAEEVAAYARATVRAYESARVFSAVKHLPGLGSADQSTQDGPATVGLGLPELRERDLVPFRAAIDAGVPGVVLSSALYPFSDFTVPAALSAKVARDLLRGELGFGGVAITDDLSDPAITALTTVPDAAVEAIRAGADMVYISGPVADQRAAYGAVLRAVHTGRIPRARLDSAVERILMAKRSYGVLR